MANDIQHPRFDYSDSDITKGQDRFRLNMLPCGKITPEGYLTGIGTFGGFWGTDGVYVNGKWHNYCLTVDNNKTIIPEYSMNANAGLSIRLVRPATPSELTYLNGATLVGIYSDYDGNIYDGVKIGTQIWLEKSLKTLHYNNGVAIPIGISYAHWSLTIIGACVTHNLTDDYGVLYNSFVVNNNPSIVTPNVVGWKIPAKADIDTLISSIVNNYNYITPANLGVMLKSRRQSVVNLQGMTMKLMPKLFRYSIVWGTEITRLVTDPKGWDEQAVSNSRTDDHGVNAEFTVPFYFSKEGRDKLNEINTAGGQFADAYVQIERRKEDWTYENFYTYKLDFKKFKDDLSFISIDGIENSVYSRVQSNTDTNYEIALPNIKKFMTYSGVSIVEKNIMQAGIGKLNDHGSNYWGLIGTRAVRTYNADIAFINVESDPYPYAEVMFRCINSTTIQDLKISLGHVIKCTGTLGTPDAGEMVLIEQDLNGANRTIKTDTLGSQIKFLPTYTHTNGWARYDEFVYNPTSFTIACTAGKLYMLVYSNTGSNYTSKPEMRPEDDKRISGINTYLSIGALHASPNINKNLCVFTHKWLIKQLLNKILGYNFTLNYLVTHINWLPVLSSEDCAKNLGVLQYDGKITTNLKSVLESLNSLCCIGIDITDNIITIADREYFYPSTPARTLSSNNISVEFDEKHCYNKFKIGWSSENKSEDGKVAFNCENNFIIPESLVDNELEIKNPFIGDPYTIDDKITNLLASTGESNSSSNEKLFVFAVDPSEIEETETEIYGNCVYNAENTQIPERTFFSGTAYPALGVAPFIPLRTPLVSNFTFATGSLFKFAPSTGTYEIDLELDMAFPFNSDNDKYVNFDMFQNDPSTIMFKDVTLNNESITLISYTRHFKASFDATNTSLINAVLEIGNINSRITINKLVCKLNYVGNLSAEYNLIVEPNAIISGFKGDAPTIYNLPMTPKRMLIKHLPYIAISNYKNTGKINYASTDINSDLVSKLSWESANVIENENISTAGLYLFFKPKSIIFDTEIDFETLTELKLNKYGYYSVMDLKSGIEYEGWINIASCNIGENQKQNWKLISRL